MLLADRHTGRWARLGLAALVLALAAAPASALVPPPGGDGPELVAQTDSLARIKWPALPGVENVVYNVLMNNVSVYTGPETTYEQTGLAPDGCYTFKVAAFANGRWTQFSKALPLATSDQPPVDVGAVLSRTVALREELETNALGKPKDPRCPLAGYMAMHFVGGDDESMEFVGSAPAASNVAFEASKRNCELAKCSRGSMATKTIVEDKVGRLFLRLDNGRWKKTFFRVPAEQHTLEFTDPRGGAETVVQDLAGCRANSISRRAGLAIGKLGDAAMRCLEVNCTAQMRPYYLCQAESGLPNHAEVWARAINRASHLTHTFNRFDVMVKGSPVPFISPKPDDGRDKSMYEHAPYREAWILTYLGQLVDLHACPHFPYLYNSFRCTDIPDQYKKPPGEDGIVPAYVRGGTAPTYVNLAKADGGVFNTLWYWSATDPVHTDLGTELERYKAHALSEDFARGVAFMLTYTLGVGRVAHGLFHNDLLALSNIKFVQYPLEAKVTPEFWCYSLSSSAFGLEAAGGEDGDGSSDTSSSDSSSSSSSGGGSDEAPGVPSAEAMCQAKQAEARRATAEPGGTPTQPKAVETDSFDGELAGQESKDRRDWCLFTGDVDGLMLKLHNYQYSSLRDRELEWWRRGYTFQNTPWADDMASLGTILCDLMGARIAEPDEQREDLCRRAKAGEFAANPLHALLHPYFGGLPAKGSVAVAKRRTFTYATTKPAKGGAPKEADGGSGSSSSGSDVSPPSPFSSVASSRGAKAAMSKHGSAPGALGPVGPADGVARSGSGAGGAGGVSGGKSGSKSGGSSGTASESGSASEGEEGPPAATPPPDMPELPRMSTPWIVRKNMESVLIKYKVPAGLDVALYNVMLNGVSVYTGVDTSYEQQELKPTECYRFQVTAFVKGKWLPLSRPLLVNDCTAYREKYCRDHDCSHLSSVDLA